jgi:hypothetical protein
MVGKTANEVVGKVQIKTTKGTKAYKRSDLNYDLKCGYLTTDPGYCTGSPTGVPTPSAGTRKSSLSTSISPSSAGDAAAAQKVKQEMARIVVKNEVNTKNGKRRGASAKPSVDDGLSSDDITKFGPQVTGSMNPEQRITQAIKRAHNEGAVVDCCSDDDDVDESAKRARTAAEDTVMSDAPSSAGASAGAKVHQLVAEMNTIQQAVATGDFGRAAELPKLQGELDHARQAQQKALSEQHRPAVETTTTPIATATAPVNTEAYDTFDMEVWPPEAWDAIRSAGDADAGAAAGGGRKRTHMVLPMTLAANASQLPALPLGRSLSSSALQKLCRIAPALARLLTEGRGKQWMEIDAVPTAVDADADDADDTGSSSSASARDVMLRVSLQVTVHFAQRLFARPSGVVNRCVNHTSSITNSHTPQPPPPPLTPTPHRLGVRVVTDASVGVHEHGLGEAIGPLILHQHVGKRRVCNLRQKLTGLQQVPRAAAMDPLKLRTLDGLLDGLRSQSASQADALPLVFSSDAISAIDGTDDGQGEGSAALGIHGTVPRAKAAVQPDGFTGELRMGDYQLESLGWMVDRETGPFTIADLFWTELRGGEEGDDEGGSGGGGGSSVYALALPAPVENCFGKAQVHSLLSHSAPDRSRGGILAEEMGMGKTVEVISLVLANKPTQAWLNGQSGGARRAATLVVVPDELVGQWCQEVGSKTQLACKRWDGQSGLHGIVRSDPGVVVLPYSCVGQAVAQNITWHRIVLDEPHMHCRATPVPGGFDFSAETVLCAQLRSPHRWCLTGTPFPHSLFDLLGQLRFLRIVGGDGDDVEGQCAMPYSYFRTTLANCFPSKYNSTADIVCSILKALTVRHTKAQFLNADGSTATGGSGSAGVGRELLNLPPCTSAEEMIRDAMVIPFDAMSQVAETEEGRWQEVEAAKQAGERHREAYMRILQQQIGASAALSGTAHSSVSTLSASSASAGGMARMQDGSYRYSNDGGSSNVGNGGISNGGSGGAGAASDTAPDSVAAVPATDRPAHLLLPLLHCATHPDLHDHWQLRCHIAHPSVSNLGSLLRNRRFPDHPAGAAGGGGCHDDRMDLPSELLSTWRRSLGNGGGGIGGAVGGRAVHKEIDCAVCLGELGVQGPAVSASSCGHLMCRGCADRLLNECGHTETREKKGIVVSGLPYTVADSNLFSVMRKQLGDAFEEFLPAAINGSSSSHDSSDRRASNRFGSSRVNRTAMKIEMKCVLSDRGAFTTATVMLGDHHAEEAAIEALQQLEGGPGQLMVELDIGGSMHSRRRRRGRQDDADDDDGMGADGREFLLTVRRSNYEVRAVRCPHPGCRAWKGQGDGQGESRRTFASEDLLLLDSVLAFDPNGRGPAIWPKQVRPYLAGVVRYLRTLPQEQRPGGHGGGGGGGGGGEGGGLPVLRVLPTVAGADAVGASKLQVLVETLVLMQKEGSGEKAVVFARDMEVVHALVHELQQRGVGARGIDAAMRSSDREAHVRALAKPLEATGDNVLVLVSTLRAGAIGLNLTSANHLFVVDGASALDQPLLRQAVARVCRIGQRKPVSVYLMATAGTCEEHAVKALATTEVRAEDVRGLGAGGGSGGGSEPETNQLKLKVAKLAEVTTGC